MAKKAAPPKTPAEIIEAVVNSVRDAGVVSILMEYAGDHGTVICNDPEFSFIPSAGAAAPSVASRSALIKSVYSVTTLKHEYGIPFTALNATQQETEKKELAKALVEYVHRSRARQDYPDMDIAASIARDDMKQPLPAHLCWYTGMGGRGTLQLVVPPINRKKRRGNSYADMHIRITHYTHTVNDSVESRTVISVR